MDESIPYVSTRSSGPVFSLREAVMQGLAPDGGLFIPRDVPRLDLADLRGCSFPDLSLRVLTRWTGSEIRTSDLADIVADALNFDVPLVYNAGGKGVHILELFHGPTLSFKDFGARFMGRLLGHLLKNDPLPVTILVATSGDTGSAVADGCSGIEGLHVVLLYPENGVSDVQQHQLAQEREGVSVLRVKGVFDDCQRLVKGAFSEPRLSHLRLTSANSINIARLLPQMLYYISSWLELDDAKASFCVPSGNLGNLTAGILAYQSGLPVRRFLAAHNRNDFLVRYLDREDAHFLPSQVTLSNAMDVGTPSNFERLTALLDPGTLHRLIHGVSVNDERTVERISRTVEETGYLPDPHTAVALEAMARYADSTRDPWIVLSTAHPAKFPETTRRATGFVPDIPVQLQETMSRPMVDIKIQPEMDELVELLLDYQQMV